MRGRYTLPWEYFIARGRPPHVEAWIAENNKSLWAKSADYARRRDVFGRRNGPVCWPSIVLLALLSRLLVLPFSLKAERDQIRARAAADELEAFKSG